MLLQSFNFIGCRCLLYVSPKLMLHKVEWKMLKQLVLRFAHTHAHGSRPQYVLTVQYSNGGCSRICNPAAISTFQEYLAQVIPPPPLAHTHTPCSCENITTCFLNKNSLHLIVTSWHLSIFMVIQSELCMWNSPIMLMMVHKHQRVESQKKIFSKIK